MPRSYSPASGPTGFRFPMVVEETGERVMIARKHTSPQLSVVYEAEDGRMFEAHQRLGHVIPFEGETPPIPVEEELFEDDDDASEHNFF